METEMKKTGYIWNEITTAAHNRIQWRAFFPASKTNIRMYACTYARMYAWMYVCMYLYVCEKHAQAFCTSGKTTTKRTVTSAVLSAKQPILLQEPCIALFKCFNY